MCFDWTHITALCTAQQYLDRCCWQSGLLFSVWLLLHIHSEIQDRKSENDDEKKKKKRISCVTNSQSSNQKLMGSFKAESYFCSGHKFLTSAVYFIYLVKLYMCVCDGALLYNDVGEVTLL